MLQFERDYYIWFKKSQNKLYAYLKLKFPTNKAPGPDDFTGKF